MTNEAGCEFDHITPVKMVERKKIQEALYQVPKDYNYTAEYLLEWFYHHQKTVIAAIEAQLTKSDESVICGGLSNVDDTSAPQVKADVVDIQVLKYDVAYKFGQAHNGVIDYIFENYNITRKTK